MRTAARDRLARTLRGDVQTAFSVELTAGMDDLRLEVEGFGRVKFPVTAGKARKLVGLGQPARFGRGEETLTDPDVRDTWEIPKDLVRAEWDGGVLEDVLGTVKDELGLPHAATLTADLHSFLVYEPNQFFVAHQDSEKDDSMVGTLVVTLPSSYAGGELVVAHNEESETYQGSRGALSLVAFYADCRHEVLSVKSGYRIGLMAERAARSSTVIGWSRCSWSQLTVPANRLARSSSGIGASMYWAWPPSRWGGTTSWRASWVAISVP
jgi:hypothetical protein